MVNITDKNKCTLCGLCAMVCPVKVLKKEDGEIVVNKKRSETDCLRCGQCTAVCPTGAVSVDGKFGIAEERYDKDILKKQLPLLYRQRRSVRIFDDEPLELNDIMPVLDIVRYSPTAKNAQCVSYTFVTGNALKDYIAYCYDNLSLIGLEKFKDVYMKINRDIIFRNAAAVLVAHAPKDRHISITDCTIAMTLFDMAAPVYNIGTCWAGYLMNLAKHDENMKKQLKIKEENEIYAMLLLGRSKIKYAHTPERKSVDVTVLD